MRQAAGSGQKKFFPGMMKNRIRNREIKRATPEYTFTATRYTRSSIHFSCKKGPIPAHIKKITMCNKGAIDFFRFG